MISPQASLVKPLVKKSSLPKLPVKAGEKAHTHRHTPNAMRIVLEAAQETYTVVDGVKIPMLPGDVLLTPNWCWYGHSNESTQDAYWIDFLDAPLTAMIGPMFFQQHPQKDETATHVEARSPMRIAFSDYAHRLLDAPECAPGVRTLVLGPATLVSFDRVAVRLARDAAWTRDRSTANEVFTVVQGSGRSRSGEREFTWSRGDMIAAPAWQDQQHVADEDSILLRVSDEPLMRMLGWYHTGAEMAAAKAQA
ncbi:cupin domain-containing protein [Ramlibacter sp.]|uniref:cupin domain-containing protein n=1 Tax=Ramlibacter sp. TaxID=1917967 RepID=UPI002636599E|nr:cupin domain-containing protein [Ramlibacter sp.]